MAKHTRHVDAVFDNEDDAQTVLIQAKILGATQCLVERFANDDVGPVSLPALGSISVNTGLSTVGQSPIINFAGAGMQNSGDDETPRALFSCHVDEHNEAAVHELIREHGGKLY